MSTENITDQELVLRTFENKENFAELIQRYEIPLKKYLLRLTGLESHDIEDIIQDVFIKVYKNLHQYKSDLKFSSWIYRITHNEAITFLRRQKRKPKIVDTEESWHFFDQVISDENVEQNFESNEKIKILNQIFEEMNEKYRDALILKFLEEKSYEEISDILKKPVGTIGTLINRGRKQFKEIALKKGIKP